LRQTVKAQISSNGEESLEFVTKEVHEGVQGGRSAPGLVKASENFAMESKDAARILSLAKIPLHQFPEVGSAVWL